MYKPGVVYVDMLYDTLSNETSHARKSEYSTARSTAQNGAAPHSTASHSTAPHGMARPRGGMAEHGTARRCCAELALRYTAELSSAQLIPGMMECSN